MRFPLSKASCKASRAPRRERGCGKFCPETSPGQPRRTRFPASAWLLLLFMFSWGCRTAQERASLEAIGSIAEDYRAVEDAANETSPDIGDNPSLSDFLTYAAFHNAELRSEFHNWRAAMEKIPQVRSLPDPRAGYGYFLNNLERGGKERHLFSLQQTLPWPGTLMLKGEAAYEMAEARRRAFESFRLEIFYRVKETYYDYYYLGRALKIIRSNYELFTDMERNAEDLYGQGEVLLSDLIRIRIQVERYRERLDSLDDLREPLMAKFNYVLGRPEDIDGAFFPFPDKIDVGSESLRNTVELAELLKSNPRLEQIARLIAAEEKNRKLALRRYIPDLTLGIEWMLDTESRDTIIPMISVNLPVYFSRYEAERREAIAKKAAFTDSREDMEKMLLADLQRQISNMKIARRKMSLYRDTIIPQAEKSFAVIRNAFMVGESSYLDFIDAQNTLLEMELSYEENLVGFVKSLAMIEKITGSEDVYAITGDD